MALSLLSKSAAWIPLEWVRPLSGVALVVPFYHMVSDAHVPHVSHLYRFRSVAEFKADLDFLCSHFEPVSLANIVDALNGTRALPESCFHLTFDDGFREMHDIVAPILHRAGVPATFFLTTAFLDGGGLSHYNILSLLADKLQSEPVSDATKARLESLLPPATGSHATLRGRLVSIRGTEKDLVDTLADTLEVDVDGYVRENQPHLSAMEVESLTAQGFTIGSHSHDHQRYENLSLADQLMQTRMSMDYLAERFGASPRAFAFPHNDSGVPDEFFKTVFSERMIEVSFGTSGLVTRRHPRNIERVSMEKTSAPATRILARQFTRATYFRICPNPDAPGRDV
jgi:peptidoglycan/xylan/chitin deacetylase (PgdA/CDA1 family)